MADISMCIGFRCPIKETCYRYKAKPNEHWQSYFKDTPYDHKKKECEYYDKVQNKR